MTVWKSVNTDSSDDLWSTRVPGGWLYLHLNRNADGRGGIQQALAFAPDPSRAHELIGKLKSEEERKDDHDAEKLREDLREALALLEHLSELRSHQSNGYVVERVFDSVKAFLRRIREGR